METVDGNKEQLNEIKYVNTILLDIILVLLNKQTKKC